MRSLTVSIVCAAAFLVLGSGCGKRETTTASGGAGPATAKKILHFGNGAEPQDLDPQILTGVPEHHLMNALFEGLVSPDPADKGIPQPGVAERWDISPDGLVYTFHLRADAAWSDGRPVTAQDFVASYRRMLTPSLGADYTYMLFHIAGAEDYYAGRITDFAQTGVKALDDRTLQLTLRQPTPFLLNAMQHYAWFPVPVHVVEKFGGLARKGTDWTRLENFVGNGPFRLKGWRPNQHLIAERSPTYWDRARVKLDEIHFYPIELADTEERMFRTGQLHVTNEVPLSKIPVYRRELPDSLRIEPWCGVYFYRFNIEVKPLDDIRVRRALALAIDRESLVKNVTLADELPASSIIPPGTAGYQSKHRLQGDLAEAKRLLAEAGYPEGRGFPKIELLYNTLEKHRTIAEAIQQMWRKNLGINIGLYNQEWKVYLDSQKRIDFQMQRAGWIADYADPHVFLDLWTIDGGNNNTHWGSARYDQLLSQALLAKDTESRFAVYQEMEKILVDELPVIPIFFYTKARLISPKVKNYHTTLIDDYPWKFADVKE